MSKLMEVAGIAVSPDHYIGGKRVSSSERFELFCPIDQSRLGELAEGRPEHVDAAIEAARGAFPAWSALSAAERKPYLDRFAEEIGRRADDFCVLESNDAGVLLSRMRHGRAPLDAEHHVFRRARAGTAEPPDRDTAGAAHRAPRPGRRRRDHHAVELATDAVDLETRAGAGLG